jgi:Spy/CpxP family protein refolding chaperone
MMRNQGLWFVFPFALLLGCQDSSGGPAPAPSASTPPAAAPSVSVTAAASAMKPRPMMGRHGGIASGLFRATNDLTLSDAQKDSLTQIETALKADDEGIRTAMKAFRADLLAGVKAGKIDTAKMTADDAVVDKAIADHQDKEATALNSLYKLLDAGQRTTVVAAVRAKQAERETRMANWNKESDGGAPDWSKKRLDKLTADLGLDAGQQKQVAAILTKSADPPNAAGMQSRWDDLKKRQDALLTAFASPTFDAKKADLTLLPGKSAHDPMDHMAAFFTQLLPVLHADQRDKLVASMDRPFGAHEGPPGMSGQGMPHHPVDDIAFPFVEPGEGSGEAPAPPK